MTVYILGWSCHQGGTIPLSDIWIANSQNSKLHHAGQIQDGLVDSLDQILKYTNFNIVKLTDVRLKEFLAIMLAEGYERDK